MSDFLLKLFSSDFMPHGYCYLWNPTMVWLHAISDGVIFLSYYLIPVALILFVRKRRDLPFHWVFIMFGLFIFGCGTTHLMEIWTLWHGTYWLAGVVKALTAGVSLATAALLIPLIPQALALPSPAQLQAANLELEKEIRERRRVEEALQRAHGELELRVRQRTAELARANEALRGEIAERQHAEEALRKAQAELAHVTRVATLGELTAAIAHEIMQPLAAVVNNASACVRWLAAHNLEEARQSAALVIADGHHAGEIIGRIRALAKRAPLQKEWFDINDTIREVLALVRSEVQKNGVSLQTRLSDNVPLILGDRIQLQQVMLNLTINAIEAMTGGGEGPRELWVRSEQVESPDVLIAVGDSGPGLDPQSLDRLFDAFYTTKPHGLGMGLAISRSIVEAHGGRLWAMANDGRGATFQFTLPIGSEKAS